MAHIKRRKHTTKEKQLTQSIDTVQSTLLKTSTELLTANIKKRRPSASKAANKIKTIFKVVEEKKALAFSKKFVEDDGVMIPGSDLSVATEIKRACLARFDEYKSLDFKGKSIIDLGANGIIYCTKESAQKKLFGNNGFDYLRGKYLPSFVSVDIFDEIVNVTDIEKKAKLEVADARAFASKKESASKGLKSIVYDMYAEYLKILQFQKKIFCTDIDVTEGDFSVKVWGPLLESLMRDDEEIRLKWGESVGDSSGVCESPGFKVDVRLVHDRYSARKSMKEVNTANVEMARGNASEEKITSDRTKLFVESKCVVDRLISEGVRKEDAVVPCLQVIGLRAILFSVRLVASGLYVGVEEGRCSVMRNGNGISNFRNAVNLLQKFRRASLHLVSVSKEESDGSDATKENRSTWIPPASNSSKIAPLPQYLFE